MVLQMRLTMIYMKFEEINLSQWEEGRSVLMLAWVPIITKYHRLGGLSCKNLFIMVLESGQSQVQMPANSIPGRSSLPGLQTTISLLYSLKVVGVETG